MGRDALKTTFCKLRKLPPGDSGPTQKTNHGSHQRVARMMPFVQITCKDFALYEGSNVVVDIEFQKVDGPMKFASAVAS